MRICRVWSESRSPDVAITYYCDLARTVFVSDPPLPGAEVPAPGHAAPVMSGASKTLPPARCRTDQSLPSTGARHVKVTPAIASVALLLAAVAGMTQRAAAQAAPRAQQANMGSISGVVTRD